MPEYHLAQINIARASTPMDDPAFQPFLDLLEEVNAMADGSPGFVWRLQDENGDATAIKAFDDPQLLTNMSVWETYDDLFDFTYRTAHAAVMARRKEWFERMGEMYMALWWIEVGHIPDLHEGKCRLEMLRAQGPGPDAFTFKKHFPKPEQTGGDQ